MTKRLILGILLYLGLSHLIDWGPFDLLVNVYAQSTTLTINVTDSGSVAWGNGTYSLAFSGQPNAKWPGGNIAPFSGSLNATGSVTLSGVPDNNTIQPSPSFWRVTVCPNPAISAGPSGCFLGTFTITGGSQTLNITPAAISIPVPSAPTLVSPITAYADAEISGGWVGFQYYQYNPTFPTSSVVRVCQGLAGGSCSTWANSGAPLVVGRVVSGAVGTDQPTTADCGKIIDYRGSVSVVITLQPLGCALAFINDTSGTATNLTITPVTWTLFGSCSQGILKQNDHCVLAPDPAVTTQWDAILTPVDPYTGHSILPCTQINAGAGADIGQQCQTLLNILVSLGLTGTLEIPTGTYTTSHNIDTSALSNGAKYSIQCGDGTNPEATIINYTGSADFIKYSQTALNPTEAGTISGCHINGTSSGVSGVHVLDTIGLHLHDMTIAGFTGASGVGFWQDNVGLYTENTNLFHVFLYNNTKGWRWTNSSGTSTTYSFTETHAWDVYCTAFAGQLCYSFESGAMFAGSLSLRCVVQVNSGAGGSCFSITGLQATGGAGASMQGIHPFELEMENVGSVAATGFSCGNGNALLYSGVIAEIGTVGTITDSVNAGCTFHAEWPFHFRSGATAAQNARWFFDPNSGFMAPNTDNAVGIGIPGAVPKSVQSYTYLTNSDCAVNSVSPAACGSAASGAFVVPTGTTAYTVNTSAVTAASRILVTAMSFAGNLPSSPTCVVPTTPFIATVSAIVAGTSFSLTLPNTTGQTCWQYWIVN